MNKMVVYRSSDKLNENQLKELQNIFIEPNNQTKVESYEKVDYERELGENYIDITGKYNYKFDNALFIGLDYVNKESKDIYYTIGNIGWQHKSGFKFGLAVKETEPLLDVGYNKNRNHIGIKCNYLSKNTC